MKKLTKFHKQLIAIVAVVLVAAVCFGVYAFQSNKGKQQNPTTTLSFTKEEQSAIRGIKGKASVTFAAEKGGANAKEAFLMTMAEDFAAINPKIKVTYGKGGDACVITAKGKTHTADMDGLFTQREDGTPYASTARAFFYTSLTGSDQGAANEALKGFNLDGDMVTQAGYAYLFDPIDKANLEYVYIQNRHDKLTFIEVDGSFYLTESEMDLDTATTATMIAAARAPVAIDTVKDPENLEKYGLADNAKATAIVIAKVKDGESFSVIIGNELPDGSGYYAKTPGKDRVYVMQSNIANYLLVPKESFLVANFGTTMSNVMEPFDTVTDIRIEFEDGDVLKAQLMSDAEKAEHSDSSQNYAWKITAPDRFISGDSGYALPDPDNIAVCIYSLSHLVSDEVVEADINEETLAEYGLDKPYRVFSWLYKGQTRITTSFSKPDENGNCHVYSVKENVSDGKKVKIGIALIKDTDFEYLHHKAFNYTSNILFSVYFDRLDSLAFSRNGKDYIITLTKGENSKVTAAKINGIEADLTSCRVFYQSFIACKVLDEYTSQEEPPKELLKVSVTKNGKTTTMSFGRISNMKAYGLVNDKTALYISYNDLEKLISDADALIAGETIK